MENMQIKLTLTLAEVQVILAKLGPHAYAEVGLLIPKIQHQAQVQVDAANADRFGLSQAPSGESHPLTPEETFAEIKARARNGTGVADTEGLPYGIALHFTPPPTD